MKRFIILNDLTEINFEEFILKEFTAEKANGLCGILKSKTNIRWNGEKVTLEEYIASFQIIYSIRPKRRPTRTIRRRGYKDHGSLGCETAQTIKLQADSEEFQRLAKEEKKRNILYQIPEAQDNPTLLRLLMNE